MSSVVDEGSVIVELTVVSGDEVGFEFEPSLLLSTPSVSVPPFVAWLASSGQAVSSVKEARTVDTLEMFRIMAIEGMPNAVGDATANNQGGGRAASVVATAFVIATVVVLGQSAPLDYDETVYFGIAREITRVGCPIRPEGAGAAFLNNPPLVCYATALAGTLGFEWAWLRAVHALLWTGLLCAGVGAWAKGEGRFAPALAIGLLASQPLLLREAALVKLDVPLAAIAALHCAYARDAMQGRDRARMLALTAMLAVLVRYQGVLLVATTLPVLWAARRRPAAAWTLAGTAFAGILWLALATACGGDLLGAFTSNSARLSAADTEPWFQRSIPVYWRDLAGAIGPTTLAAAAVAVALRGRALARRPGLVLAALFTAVNLAFCSLIALKAERYFMPGFAALAVLASSLPEALARAGARAVRWIASGLVLATGVSLGATLLLPRRPEINAHYRDVAAVVDASLAPDACVLLPYAQVAWLADRRYVISLFEPDAARLLARLSDPSLRIELVVRDARIAAFHPLLGVEGRAAIDAYLAQHFEPVPTSLDGTTVLRRVSW